MHKKRGTLKCQLTLIKQYSDKLSDPISSKEITNEQMRFNKISPIYDEFNDIQNEIQCLTDNAIEFTELEQFQDEFFDLISRANTITMCEDIRSQLVS